MSSAGTKMLYVQNFKSNYWLEDKNRAKFDNYAEFSRKKIKGGGEGSSFNQFKTSEDKNWQKRIISLERGELAL